MSVTSKIKNNIYKEIIIKEKEINDEMNDLILKMPIGHEPLNNKKVNEDRCKDMEFNVNDYSAPILPTLIWLSLRTNLKTQEPIEFATKVGELKPVKPMYDRYLWKDKLTNRYYKIRNKIKNCIFRKIIALRHYIKTIKFVWE